MTMTKLVDSKGRVALGSRFANRMVLIDESEPGRIIIMPAVAIPEHEAWLYKNQDALGLVRQGLADAREGRFAEEAPDVAKDAEDDELVEKLAK
jgi:hypothetical protein